MGYKDMETGLATVIKLLAGYSITNVSQGDYRIMGHGNLDCVVLNPGPIFQRSVVGAPRRMQTIWIVDIEHYLGFRGEISLIADDIRVKRQALLDHLDKYPTLNNTANCINAFIREGREPRIIPGDPQRWWTEVMRMYIEERTTVTIAE